MEPHVSNVSWTPCIQNEQGAQNILKSNGPSDNVDVEFTNEGVKIAYSNFAVTCDFTAINVTHTFVNGFLNITQQGLPNQADCVCYTDVSYTIEGVLQNEVNVIFINGEQVYCYNNENNQCQRSLRLSLNDIGVCTAYFEKEISFNIGNLQIQGDRSVQLNIGGKSILYEY